MCGHGHYFSKRHKGAPFTRFVKDSSRMQVCELSGAYFVEYWNPSRTESHVDWYRAAVSWRAAVVKYGPAVKCHGVLRFKGG